MKTDMITLFNRLTSQELADYSLFSHMIDLHYEKFKYLYYVLKDIELSHIDNIVCVENVESISVTITPASIEHTSEIMFDINKRKDVYKKKEYFHIDIESYANAIQIDISIAGNEKEGDLYASRLI